MSTDCFLTSPIAERLTWVLLNFIWQAAVIAGAMAAMLRLLASRTPQARYATLAVGMIVMGAAPLLTFVVLALKTSGTSAPNCRVSPERIAPPFSDRNIALAPSTPMRAFEAKDALNTRDLTDWARQSQPFLLTGWVVGVMLFGVRLILGMFGVRAWKRSGRALPDSLAANARRLARCISVSSQVRCLASDRVNEAVVAGFWRPVVLIPAAWIAEMTPDILEAILAHELAHIRRWDLWANLAQRLVETAFFYHPATWWLSTRLTWERELCCDDLAVAATGRPARYAAALEQAARRRSFSPATVLAPALGTRNALLLRRVARVLGVPAKRDRARLWPVGLVALAVPLGVWIAVAAASTRGQKPTIVPSGKPSMETIPLADAATRKSFSIRFEGNDAASDMILRNWLKLEPGVVTLWDEKQIEEGKARLTAHYRGLGHLDIRVTHSLQSDGSQNRFILTFRIEEGPRYVVRKLLFVGNGVLSKRQLARLVTLVPGAYLDVKKLAGDIKRMQKSYSAFGYPYADIKLLDERIVEGQQIDLIFFIREGKHASPETPALPKGDQGDETDPGTTASFAATEASRRKAPEEVVELQKRIVAMRREPDEFADAYRSDKAEIHLLLESQRRELEATVDYYTSLASWSDVLDYGDSSKRAREQSLTLHRLDAAGRARDQALALWRDVHQEYEEGCRSASDEAQARGQYFLLRTAVEREEARRRESSARLMKRQQDVGQKLYDMHSRSYGIVVSDDAKGDIRVAGINKHTGEWKWLAAAQSNQIRFEPIMGDDVTAFILHGEPLSQLVVYNGRLNKWSAFPLQVRVIDAIPYVGDRIVCYQLPDRVVAYSAARDAWGMMLTQATPAVGDDGVLVETAKGRYEFPDKNSSWSIVPSSTARNQR